MKSFPTLYHRGKNGSIHSWRVWTEDVNIITEHGLVNGKKQISSKIAEPKNIGKKNSTTAEQQAEIEAKAMYVYKLSRKYSLTPEKAQQPVLLPMLAKDFKDRKHKNVVYPGYVQRKYDGVRCLARWEGDKIVLISRNGKYYNCPHIIKELQEILTNKEDVFDGELYVHGVGFQTIASWVKKLQDETKRIEYHVYDIPESYNEVTEDVSDNLIWEDRVKLLEKYRNYIENGKFKNIKIVPSYRVNNEKEVYSYQAEFVSEGFEGAIFRNLGGLYNYGYRSDDLLKVKSFDEDDFEVVGYESGKGKDKDTVIWVCKTGSGDVFNVRPSDTYENRKEYFRNAKNYIGLMLSVKYFGLTDEKLPRFPVALGFKDDR